MAKSKFTKSRISGVVTYVPSNVRFFDEESKLSNFDEKQIERIKKILVWIEDM